MHVSASVNGHILSKSSDADAAVLVAELPVCLLSDLLCAEEQ